MVIFRHISCGSASSDENGASHLNNRHSGVGESAVDGFRHIFLNSSVIVINMSEENAADRLAANAHLAAELRALANADPMLTEGRQALRAWQAVRLARTHSDLLGSPRMGAAASFFLTDIYGAKDLSQRDAEVMRVVPTIVKLVPAAGLVTVADAIELDALSEGLDLAMVRALGRHANAIDAQAYGKAYRQVGRRPERERQIDLVEHVGRSLDKLTHQPFISSALALMRKPARLAGLGGLQDFLERGYHAFRKMGNASEFLELVVTRERKLMEAVFAGDDSLLT